MVLWLKPLVVWVFIWETKHKWYRHSYAVPIKVQSLVEFDIVQVLEIKNAISCI